MTSRRHPPRKLNEPETISRTASGPPLKGAGSVHRMVTTPPPLSTETFETNSYLQRGPHLGQVTYCAVLVSRANL
jgi:hypothetical protein